MSEEQLDEIVLDQQENERIGFGRRLGAYLLDFLFVMIIGAIISSIAGKELAELFFAQNLEDVNQSAEAYESLGFDIDMVGVLTSIVQFSSGATLGTLLFFLLEGTMGQSAGKILLNIVNTDIDGSKASAGKLWLRSFLKYGSTIISLIGGIVGISILGVLGSFWGFIIFIGFFFAFSDKKQTIHDMIAKTVVSRK